MIEVVHEEGATASVHSNVDAGRAVGCLWGLFNCKSFSVQFGSAFPYHSFFVQAQFFVISAVSACDFIFSAARGYC